jgi:hypothetical protein
MFVVICYDGKKTNAPLLQACMIQLASKCSVISFLEATGNVDLEGMVIKITKMDELM